MKLIQKFKSLKSSYAIFFLAASFYLYEFILQVAPSVMADPMMRSFGVTGEGFGIISAFYFYAYAPMQLPAGVLFDRYGPRKLMTFAILLCAFGALFFAATNSIEAACLGRFLIGAGSAFSFIGVLVLLSRWFPPHYFAILAGVAQLMSSVGAIAGEMPLAYLIETVGWREATFILAGIGFLLAGAFWLYIRDFPDQRTQKIPGHYLREEWKRLVAVCQHAQTWLVGLYAFAIWTPIVVFAALWGVPYLQAKFHIGLSEAAALCSLIWIGIGIGSPALGWLSDHINSRRLALGLSGVLGLVSSLLLLYWPGISLSLAPVILFVFGLGASGQTVSFAVVKENNEPQHMGTASGFNNLSVLIGGAIFQPLVGWMLQRNGNVQIVDGATLYDIASYQQALVIIPACFFLSIVAAFLMKETHPEVVSSKFPSCGGVAP